MMSKSGGVAPRRTRRTTPERMRGTTVLGVVLAMFAMLLTPVAAQAAAGDFAWGVVTVDANKNGAIDASGAAGQVDKGLAGAKVEIVDAADAVVAETVTGADGSWSVADAPTPDSGPYKVRVTTSDANGDVYAFPASAADPNDFARGSTANVGLADLPDDGELNALVYPVWSLDLALAADAEGLNGTAIRTGTGPFDANDSEPGNDSGMANDRVRSADIVSFNWSLTADSEESLGDSFTDVVFEQTIEMEPGAVVNFANRPAVCDPVKSTIVAQPSGSTIQAGTTPPAGTTSVTLSCYLGAMGEDKASYLFPTSVQPMATSENGSTFTTTSRAYAVDPTGTATAQPSAGVDSPPIEITAAPRYDVEKINGDAAGGYYGNQTINGVQTYGMYSYYTVQISTDRTVGVEAFQQPITMQESFWAVRSVEGPNGEEVGTPITDLKWYITNCMPSPAPRSGQTDAGLVYGKIGAPGSVATAANSVRDSGTCTIGNRTADDTGSYTLSMNGIDTSGLSYPTQTVAGASLAAGPYYVASYRVQVFIPMSELDRTQGAPDDGVGEFSIFNRVGDFDPVGTSGASNFGSGVEPGYCESGEPADRATKCDDMEDETRSNNVVGPHTKRIAPGSWAKYFIDATTGWSTGYGWINGGGNHDGAALVQPGQAFTSMQNLSNTATDWSSAQMCDVFDNTVLKLVPLNKDISSSNPYPDDLYSAVLRTQPGIAAPSPADQIARQGEWITKYGHVDLSGDDPNSGVFDTETNRWEGDWSKQRAAASGANTICGSDAITWYDSPTEVPGGIDAVNVVWTQTASDYVFKAGYQETWRLAFEQRDSYHGGPHDGGAIPAGTVAANYGSVKTSGWLQGWNRQGNDTAGSPGYIPGAGTTAPLPAAERWPGENGATSGDRWTVVRAQMNLKKRTIAGEIGGDAASGVADFGITGSAVAGKPVIWEITSTLTAIASPAAPVNNVVITDTLPEYVIYDEAGTAALATAGGFPMPTSVTPNSDGTTTLVWNLGTRTPNQDLPVLKVATTTDTLAPNNTFVVNKAAITADGIVPVSAHRDDHTVKLEQAGGLQLKKSVDKTLDLQNDTQEYTLQLKNFGDTLPILAPTVIDVLPYNGDATNDWNVNRSPASEFTGQNRLQAAPEAFEFDGETPLAGTFYYTTADPATVPQNLNADTDPSIWSTTFTANATAFKFVAANPLSVATNPSKSGLTIKFTTDQTANSAGDFYSNRFTAFSNTLKNGQNYQLLTSNLVSVRVVGFTVGDLVWFDTDGDGKFTEGTDRPVSGIKVEVYDETDTKVGEATTDADGRWSVSKLPRGKYYAVIPASEFGAGKPLEGATPAPNASADPDADENENTDHHAIANGGGARSAGLLTLDADDSEDPIRGLEPTNDNVKGLVLPPMTGDDFTNLTLDMAFVPAVSFKVSKVVDGPAASYGVGPFQIQVACTFNGQAAPGYPKTLTFNGAGEQTLTAPLGSKCAASETGTGNATSVAIAPQDGITLDDEDGEFALTVTNTFEVGSLKIAKRVEGAGAGIAQTGRTYTFTVACVFNGRDVPVQTVTLTDDGSGTLASEEITGLPVGATCTVTETSAGGADTTPQPLQVVIDGDPETVQEVGPFVNEFSAGTLDIAKALDGDAKDDAFLLDQQYTLDLVCQVAEGVDYFRGSVTLKPGAAQPVTVGDSPLLLPVGARCWIDGESVDQGAKAASFNFDGYDNAAIVVAQEDSAQSQTLELSAVNTFDQATLTVSKKVVGPGTGKAYDFELACTYPVQGENGVEDVEYPLADGDAKFSLKDGQTKTVTVPAGVSCKVVETNVPDGATVTIEDSDGTTEGGVTDGEVTELEGTENFVQVTNTFPNPPLKNTGGELPVGALWAGAGLLVAGAALLLARRNRRDRAILGDRDSGGDI